MRSVRMRQLALEGHQNAPHGMRTSDVAVMAVFESHDLQNYPCVSHYELRMSGAGRYCRLESPDLLLNMVLDGLLKIY